MTARLLPPTNRGSPAILQYVAVRNHVSKGPSHNVTGGENDTHRIPTSEYPTITMLHFCKSFFSERT